MESKPRIRVLWVDDNQDLAMLFSRLVASQPDMESVGTLPSAAGLVERACTLKPDVIVLDLTMPGPKPLDVLAALVGKMPSVRAIVFSGYDDDVTVQNAARAGAHGLASKNSEPKDVLTAIRTVAGGGRSFLGRDLT